MYKSDKIVSGFSTAFRQWRAKDSHCSLLHGYSISFKLYFEADELDDRNWVQDFGFLKRPFHNFINVKEWFNSMFDHTTVVSKDDPQIDLFMQLDSLGSLKLIVLPDVRCEKFAENVYFALSDWIKQESNGRVRLVKVKCIENENNSASYEKR